jgi:hypothetical protein
MRTLDITRSNGGLTLAEFAELTYNKEATIRIWESRYPDFPKSFAKSDEKGKAKLYKKTELFEWLDNHLKTTKTKHRSVAYQSITPDEWQIIALAVSQVYPSNTDLVEKCEWRKDRKRKQQ